MAKQKKTPKKIPKKREAPSGVRNTVKRGVNAMVSTTRRMLPMLLIWATWLSLCQFDSLRPGLLAGPPILWCICLYADIARECAWFLMALMCPQWLLSLMLPEERSIGQYAMTYKLTEKHKKQKGGSVDFCSVYGINVWRGFIEVIISAHNNNKSWGGLFTLEDLRMSGHRCRIKMPPGCEGTKSNLLLDFAKLAELLKSEFCPSPNGVLDKYIKLLYNDMTNAPLVTTSQLFKFLRNHPALKSPRQLTTFTSELFQAYKMLGPAAKTSFDSIVSAIRVTGWVKYTVRSGDKLLNKVLTYSPKDPNNIKPSYDPTSEHLFRFLRNFQQHGGDSDVTTGEQNLYNMKDLEFICTYEYCAFIHELIFQLIVKTDMKGMMLEYAWDNYTQY